MVVTNHPAITDPKKVGELLRAIDKGGSAPSSQPAGSISCARSEALDLRDMGMWRKSNPRSIRIDRAQDAVRLQNIHKSREAADLRGESVLRTSGL